MPGKTPAHNRIKTHWTYTFVEAADALGVHKNTISRWVQNDGLVALTEQRPFLIRGADLKAFLIAKRQRNRSKCGPCEIYCFRCRKPQKPAAAFAEFTQLGETHGRLTAFCGQCDAVMNRAIKIADLPAFQRQIEVTHTGG